MSYYCNAASYDYHENIDASASTVNPAEAYYPSPHTSHTTLCTRNPLTSRRVDLVPGKELQRMSVATYGGYARYARYAMITPPPTTPPHQLVQ